MNRHFGPVSETAIALFKPAMGVTGDKAFGPQGIRQLLAGQDKELGCGVIANADSFAWFTNVSSPLELVISPPFAIQ